MCIETAPRDHPLRTPSGVEKMPPLPHFPSLDRIETAIRDHPLRTPYGVEKLPRSGTTPCAPRLVSRKSHACHALDDRGA